MVEMFFPGLWWLKYAVGAIAGAIAAVGLFSLINTVWWLPAAVDQGREMERAASLKRSMELIEQRSRTNAEIRNLDSAGLCRALGGLLKDGQCE